MCEGGSARASRIAMRCHATHLYRPMRSLNRRPTWQALRRCPPTPGGGPPPLGSKDWTFRRSPEQLGTAAPPRRCRRPRDDSPPNRLQRAFITPLHPLHPLVCGKIFFGLSCASKVTSVGWVYAVGVLARQLPRGPLRWRELPPSESAKIVSFCIILYHKTIHM